MLATRNDLGPNPSDSLDYLLSQSDALYSTLFCINLYYLCAAIPFHLTLSSARDALRIEYGSAVCESFVLDHG